MIIDKDLRTLLSLMPKLSVDLIEFRAFFKELGKTALGLARTHSQSIPSENFFTFNKQLFRIVKELPQKQKKLNKVGAQKLLQLYFYQINRGSPVFLDLREKNFHQAKESAHWKPSFLTHQFDPNFTKGVQKLYNGFFSENPALFREGLRQMKMLPSHLTEQQQREIIEIIQKHFGNAREEEVLFKLKDFQNSFTKLFECFLRYKVKISSDFACLGLYILCLYIHLESIGEPVNTVRSYWKALNLWENYDQPQFMEK